ncbi:ATP-binding protein [Streptomyces goshikiensis]|uniref:ATP-binding protein n=1 Tax=Streptomyces goshikiensis TaxID=1942 RepID=UPI0036C8283A
MIKVQGAGESWPADALPLPVAPPPFTIAQARDMVAEALRKSGLVLRDDVVADALMVTSELVTNAMRHGGGLAGFHAEVRDGDFRVLVADRTPDLPRTRTHPATGPRIGGYGWPLIRSLAHHVTVTPHRSGKHITAILRLA